MQDIEIGLAPTRRDEAEPGDEQEQGDEDGRRRQVQVQRTSPGVPVWSSAVRSATWVSLVSIR